VIASVFWTLLVTLVIFLALSRTIAAWRDRRLIRAGLSAASPIHLHLRHMIEVEDHLGIALTITAFVGSAILAVLLTNAMFDTFVRKLVQLFSLR
jgi:hypothetical protein